MRIISNLQKYLAQLTLRQALKAILTLFLLMAFATFFDWLVLNWLSGCCNGGECIPEWVYPQCRGGRHD